MLLDISYSCVTWTVWIGVDCYYCDVMWDPAKIWIVKECYRFATFSPLFLSSEWNCAWNDTEVFDLRIHSS